MRDDVLTPWSTSKLQGTPPNVGVAHHYSNDWIQNSQGRITSAGLTSSRVETTTELSADLFHNFKPSSELTPSMQSFGSNILQPLRPVCMPLVPVHSGSDSHDQDGMEAQIPCRGAQNWSNSPGAQRKPAYMIEHHSLQSSSGSIVQSQRQVLFEADQYINPEIARLREKHEKE